MFYHQHRNRGKHANVGAFLPHTPRCYAVLAAVECRSFARFCGATEEALGVKESSGR